MMEAIQFSSQLISILILNLDRLTIYNRKNMRSQVRPLLSIFYQVNGSPSSLIAINLNLNLNCLMTIYDEKSMRSQVRSLFSKDAPKEAKRKRVEGSSVGSSSWFKEAEKLAIKNISGPSVGLSGFLDELDELEDEFVPMQQVNGFGGGTTGSQVGTLTVKATTAVANEIGPRTIVLQSGGLEELEPTELMSPFSNGFPPATTTTQRKPLMRLSLTSITKATGKST